MKKPFTLRQATPADLVEVKRWLELEDRDEGASFLCNFNLIEHGCVEGRLTVAVDENDIAVSLYLPDNDPAASPCIVTTNPKQRSQGAARQLVMRHFEDAQARGDLGMLIETKPETSIPFWKSMGFVPCQQAGPRRMIRTFLTSRAAPDGHPPLSVVIDNYVAHSTTLLERRALAAFHDGAEITLTTDFIVFANSADDILRISVNDVAVHAGRLKDLPLVTRQGHFARVRSFPPIR